MSRWHRKSCINPTVVQLDESLICKECFETAPTEEESSRIESIPAPPTEPTGPGRQLNLSWPSSVEYLQVDESDNEVSAPDLSTTILRVSQPPPSNPASSILHSDKLVEWDKIRLLEISPSPQSSPLHGTLRPVGLMSRPDYDALSYTWADENGDDTLRRRGYIGPFWDNLPIP